MSGFHALSTFSAAQVLIVGLTTSAGAYGLGSLLLVKFETARLPGWWHAVRFLLGLEVFSLATQVIAMAQAASAGSLVLVWVSLVLIGCPMAVLKAGPLQWPQRPQTLHIDWTLVLTLAVLTAAVTVNLLISINPSTKIDELHYHMLTPSRVLDDGALRFYLYPVVAAIVPQMFFQLGFAPLHAVGVPDAGNVVNWSAAVLMVVTAVATCRSASTGLVWALVSGALVVVGLHPAVYYVSSGTHAIGDLAGIALVVGIGSLSWQPSGIRPGGLALGVGVLAVAAAASKVSTLPLALLLQATAMLLHLRHDVHQPKVWLLSAAPWLVFYAPLVIWTAASTGSPFGALPVPLFTSNLYHAGEVDELVAGWQQAMQGSLMSFAGNALLNPYVPVAVWLLALVFLGWSRNRRVAIALAVLLAMQALVIFTSLPHYVRFFGGLHYGIAILGVAALAPFVARKRWVMALAAASLVPWLAAQIYYAPPFILALTSREQQVLFQRRYIPMADDFLALDRLLPSDAQLLFQGVRGPGVYSPRSVVYDARDLVPNKPAYVLQVEDDPSSPHVPLLGLTESDRLYVNNAARIYTYRQPGAEATIGRVSVYRLPR